MQESLIFFTSQNVLTRGRQPQPQVEFYNPQRIARPAQRCAHPSILGGQEPADPGACGGGLHGLCVTTCCTIGRRWEY